MSEAVATSQQELVGKYKPYPEYKDSGVEWLGNVPEHWVLTRVKDVAVVFGGYPFDSRRFSPDVGVPLIRIRDINTELTAVYFDGDVPKEAIIENNDVLIGMDGEFNVARWKGGKAALNQRVACVRADSDELTTLLYYMLPFNLKVVNDLTYYTTVKHLSLEDIKKTIFALPQGEELSNIVAYLDHETARIDRLIALQQRLIELLKEKRQAVISHAVTKGLNPNAPMKNSGVEWLGQVPEHWEVTRSKFVSEIFVPQRNKPELNDIGDGIFWATMEDMKNDEINETRRFVSSDAATISGSKVLQKGAVVASCVGNFGVAALLNVDVIINQQLQAYIPKAISGQYLRDLISISKTYFELVGTAATLIYVNKEGFGNMPVTRPPIEEQLEIEKYNNKIKEKFEHAIAKGELQVSLLQERRTALISAAVTGKIDLRGWTPPAEEAAT